MVPVRFLVITLFLSLSALLHAGGYQNGFIPNKGQWPEAVQHKMSVRNGAVFLEKQGITYVMYDGDALEKLHGISHDKRAQLQASDYQIAHHALKVHFLNSNSVQPKEELPGATRYNFYIGKDRRKWAGGLQAHQQVRYENLYPGATLLVKTHEVGMKYDFLLEPGTDYRNIKLEYEGARSIKIRKGTLVVETSLGEVIEQAPVVWQIQNGERVLRPAKWVLKNKVAQFEIDQIDPSLPLVIDPQIVFATYSGATSDNWGYTATYDNQGNGYSGGIVFGTGFPQQAGAYQQTFGGGQLDIGLLKYSPDGTSALYVTFMGGNDMELPHSLMVNEYGELIIFGTTGSNNFPVTNGAHSNTFQGGPSTSFENGYIQIANGLDIFVARLSTDGSTLLASTYVGGTGNDGFNGAFQLVMNYADEIRGSVWVDNDNNIYVGTSTTSTDFPVSESAIQPAYGGGLQDGVLFKLNGSLSNLEWATYLGGNDADGIFYLSVDNTQEVVVTGGTVSPNFPTTPGVLFPTQPGGVDGFVAKIDSAGSQLIASTYFGSAIYDQSYIVGTDKTDHVYVFGQTSAFDNTFSLNSPISVPGGNQFLSKLSPDLSSMVWSTTFGNATGMPDISPTALLVDVCDKIYVTGWGGIINGFGTSTSGLPVTADAFQSNTDGNDFYLYVIDNQAQNIEYASFLGGTTSFDHVDGGTSRFDRKGVIYQSICAGCGGLSDLPVTPNAYSATNNASNCNNALVKFDFESPITVSAFVNADDPVGCAPYTVNFENTSVNADVFSWRLGNQEIGTSQNLSYTFQNSGTFEVVLIASSTLTCNESDTVSITITVLSQISGSLPELEACAGTTLILGPNTFTEPYFDFNWYPGTGLSDDQVRNPQITLDSSITYQLVISVGSCTDTLVQNLTALGGSRQSLEDISLCLFDSTTIGLDIPYPGTPQYTWSPQTDIQVLNGYQAIVFPEADQNYELLVDLGNGCADTFDVAVDVRMDPIDAGPDVDACEGQTLSIGAPGDPTAYLYNWSPSAGLNDATAANPMATVSNDITYTLFRIPLPGTPGCPGIDSLAVNIVPKPLAGFFSESFAGCKGVSVAFTDTSLNAQSLRWEFSTGDISTDSKPEIVFPFSDTLKVTLIAENGECRDTMLYSEFIEGLTQYFKENDANAFSPNGDGVNDCFSPALQNLPKPHDEAFAACSDLAIYDRWGLKLYDSAYGPENVNTCWNGKNEKGELMPDGVYFYVFHFDGKERAGTVHLRLGE